MITIMNRFQGFTHYLAFVSTVALLTACGAGDSSSGGGGGNTFVKQQQGDPGQPFNFGQWVGSYQGNVTQTPMTLNGSGAGTFPLAAQIDATGRVTAHSGGPAPVCIGLTPVFLTSNPLNFPQTSNNCTVAGSSSICSWQSIGTLTLVARNNVTGTRSGTVTCPEGSFNFQQTFALAGPFRNN